MSVSAARQLSIFDELDRRAQREPLRRLGDGPELGRLLLQPLVAKGWTLHRVRAFAGEGVLFVLERDGLEVRRVGESLGEVAVALFEEACRFTPVVRA